MRALEPEVANAVWEAVEGLIPIREVNHPMGGHRPRIPDHICFQGILIRLVTGCSWVSTEHLLGGAVSDTTLRARRDEWTEAGVSDAVVSEALAAYDRIIGLDLSDVSVDGSQHKAPCGGEGTGKNPCDRAKLGFKWSLATDRAGIPVGWAIDGANRHDSILFDPTLEAVDSRGLVLDIETLHLDRGYDSNRVRNEATARGIDDIICPKKRPRGQANHIKIKTQPPSVCDGPSSGPTHGSPTTGNYAATPTATPNTAPPTRPRNHVHNHYQTHQLAKPLEPYQLTPIRARS